MNIDELDLVPGFEKNDLQGKIWVAQSEEELREGIEQAFDYRGDVTITRRDGASVEGYIFDRHAAATLAESYIRLLLKDQSGKKISIPYSDIAGLAFTGRDTAAGKSWEAWVKKYHDKRAAGEHNIELRPESLD